MCYFALLDLNQNSNPGALEQFCSRETKRECKIRGSEMWGMGVTNYREHLKREQEGRHTREGLRTGVCRAQRAGKSCWRRGLGTERSDTRDTEELGLVGSPM